MIERATKLSPETHEYEKLHTQVEC